MATPRRGRGAEPAARWLLAVAAAWMPRCSLAEEQTVHFEQAYDEVFGVTYGDKADPDAVEGFLGECSAKLAIVNCLKVGESGESVKIRIEGATESDIDTVLAVLEDTGGVELPTYGWLTFQAEAKYSETLAFEGDYEQLLGGEEELFLSECTEVTKEIRSAVTCDGLFEGSIVVEFRAKKRSDVGEVVTAIKAEGLTLPSFGKLIPINVTLTLADKAELPGTSTLVDTGEPTETPVEGGTDMSNGTNVQPDIDDSKLLEGMDSSGDTPTFLIVAAVSGALGATVVLCVAAALFYWCFQRRHRRSSERPTLTPKAEVVKSSNVATGADTPSGEALSSENPRPPEGYLGGSGGRVARPKDLAAASIIATRSPWESIPELDRSAPGYWEHRDLSSGKVCWVKVAPDELESLQRLVNATFRSTATRDRVGGHMPSSLRIVLAHRIENPSLWKRYVIDRHAIDQKRMSRCTPLSLLQGDALTSTVDAALGGRLKPEVNEAYLWHGTRPESATRISSSGFKREHAGSGGSHMGKGMYGSGMYFAENSSKSDEYAKEDEEGAHAGLFCLMLCRVTLGEMMHMTAGGEHTHDMIATGLDAGIYDSVLGDRQASVGTYREFVVYEEALAYPEYVIVYERQFRTPSSEPADLPV